MKIFIHKIMSISMALVVLLSTISMTIDMHYCGETMVDFSLFHNVKSCGMEKAPLVYHCENSEINKKPCCSDQQLIVEGTPDLKGAFNNFTPQQQLFVSLFLYSYIGLFEGTVSKEVPFFDYAPPFVKRDVQVWQQTFLI
jgi:hypothetical protein